MEHICILPNRALICPPNRMGLLGNIAASICPCPFAEQLGDTIEGMVKDRAMMVYGAVIDAQCVRTLARREAATSKDICCPSCVRTLHSLLFGLQVPCLGVRPVDLCDRARMLQSPYPHKGVSSFVVALLHGRSSFSLLCYCPYSFTILYADQGRSKFDCSTQSRRPFSE